VLGLDYLLHRTEMWILVVGIVFVLLMDFKNNTKKQMSPRSAIIFINVFICGILLLGMFASKPFIYFKF
jgi:hypothetical protein